MDIVSKKSVVRKRVKIMIVLGVGLWLAVTVGFAPVTTWGSFQNPVNQTCRFNGQFQDNYLMWISENEGVIMARGGNRSSGGRGCSWGIGQRRGDNSKCGYTYGPGNGTGTGERPGEGSGYRDKRGAVTGDCDGTGPNGKGRANQRYQENLKVF